MSSVLVHHRVLGLSDSLYVFVLRFQVPGSTSEAEGFTETKRKEPSFGAEILVFVTSQVTNHTSRELLLNNRFYAGRLAHPTNDCCTEEGHETCTL